MNIRKNIDYTAMYAQIDTAMQAELTTMARYFAIGQAVAERPEKGAAVAAAEYIQKNWPDEKGYSPRNLRRMRELYRVYGDCPEAIALAEPIGWTQNVVILEADLDLSLRLWYMKSARQFGWSKLELIEMIENAAHTEIVLDNGLEVCDNEVKEIENSVISRTTTPIRNILSSQCRLIRSLQYRGNLKNVSVRWFEVFAHCLSNSGTTTDGMLHNCVRFDVGYRIYIGRGFWFQRYENIIV